MSDERAMPFIVGMGRSGTTLLRLILDSHPELAIPPETHFLPRALNLWREGPREGALHRLLAAITTYPRWDDFGIAREAYLSMCRRSRARTPEAALRLFYRCYAERFGKERGGDKTPPYVFHMIRIQEVLPEAHFIHIIRDGRDVYASRKQLWFGESNPRESARRWSFTIRCARAQVRFLRHYMEVRFEDLVTDLASTARRVCGFMELPWSDEVVHYRARAMERLEELNRDIVADDGTAILGPRRVESLARVAQPLDPARVGRWKEVLSPEEAQAYARAARDTLVMLGYYL